jgi:NAD(P)-dependent dehydrogenase (short-subunit alcohol dehydrogenase family)
MMDVNVTGVMQVTRAAAEALKARKGAVVNLSSVAGIRPYGNLAAYCVSKAAVEMYTRCAALDFAPFGVRVNAVAPGVVVTELHTVTGAVADYAGSQWQATHPIGRVGRRTRWRRSSANCGATRRAGSRGQHATTRRAPASAR